ncbi:hypothetical protein MTX20_08480 [Bradyrhizobium sp. ISRA435]|nr:hypothetical protein MTX20_08480 [Bradyrhizobium sp. ISRA435]
MLATSATSPARLSETMRRVRLENDSAKKNWPARRSQPSGRRQPFSLRHVVSYCIMFEEL